MIAGTAASLAAPAIAQTNANTRLLRFIPQADLTVLDPMWTTAYVTRNHGFMVFDTLFGQDSQYSRRRRWWPGSTTEKDGKLWTLGLRVGLKFHDGEPVRAQDCVASIQRWGKRDAFGQALMAATDELSAPDDRTIVFRLKRPFPLLPAALGKTPGYHAGDHAGAAGQDRPVHASDRDGRQRARTASRPTSACRAPARSMSASPTTCRARTARRTWTAGPKIVNFDRVEWTTIPDPTTAAAGAA